MAIMTFNKIKSTLGACMMLAMLCACHSSRSLTQRENVWPDAKPQNHIQTLPGLSELSSEEKSEQTEQTWQDSVRATLDALMMQEAEFLSRSQLGLYVYDLTDNVPLYARNENQRMRPASCQKVVTSVAALHYLGTEYQLRTQLCTTGEVVNGKLNGDLYIIGGMDPMLSKDDLHKMARDLQQAGVKELGGKIYVDLSKKDNSPLGWGWCWDDDYGPLTALSLTGKSTFREEWLKALQNCRITVPASAKTNAERVLIDGVLSMPAVSEFQHAECPATATQLSEVTHRIDELLQTMMKQSDNIYAESLFYQLAFQSGERKAGRKQAVSLINDLIASLNLEPSSYQIADGSGLSLYDYLSPTLLVALLRYADSQASISPLFLNSLPVAGVDGTLKNRMKGTRAEGNVRAKTGTVNGISSLSGYLTSANGHRLCFSIINQGVEKGSLGRDFQDKVCLILTGDSVF